MLKEKSDNSSFGLILCKTKDKIEAEYSLRDINKPSGISEYEITKCLPKDIKSNILVIEIIESEFEHV